MSTTWQCFDTDTILLQCVWRIGLIDVAEDGLRQMAKIRPYKPVIGPMVGGGASQIAYRD